MRPLAAWQAQRILVTRASAPVCAFHAPSPRRQPTPTSLRPRTFRRTFLASFFPKPPREVRTPEYEPGWMAIMVWRSRMMDNLRPQPRKDLMDAWKKLMESKRQSRRPLNSTQALQCRRLLQYLADTAADDKVKQLSTRDLSVARDVLLQLPPIERSIHHLDLAKALYDVWASGNYSGKVRSLTLQWSYMIKTMCHYGGSEEALEELMSKWNDAEYSQYLGGEDGVVGAVAAGLAREGREEDLLKLVTFAEGNGIPFDARLQEVITSYYAQHDRIAETKHWFGRTLTDKHSTVNLYRTIAVFAARNGLEEWALPIFVELGQLQPKKRYWDVIMQGMLLLGKSVNDVDIIMSHMVYREETLTPNIQTYNGLLRVAADMKDVRMATSLMTSMARREVTPDAETALILFRIRMDTDSLEAAAEEYQNVQLTGAWEDDTNPALLDEYQELMDRYFVLLCEQPQPDFSQLIKMLHAVDEGMISLQPETVAALCKRFLDNDQHFDVMDVLSAHTFKYSQEQRDIIQGALTAFCLDPDTSTARAWAAYQLLHQFFQDLTFKRRTQLLDSFFKRKRPDMAVFVFSHMREHRSKGIRPKVDTYVTSLEGLAKYPDLAALESVHNHLKMDTTVQLDTRLYTALMLAYASCGKPLIALDLWDEVSRMPEGPSYATIEAVFWTLQNKPRGDGKAREIWQKIERMDLEIPPSVYSAYVNAIAASGSEKEVQSLIMQMDSFVGTPPDLMTLGLAYNALPNPDMQTRFQDWAKKRYRSEWTELEKKGRYMNEYSLCQFRIERIFKAS